MSSTSSIHPSFVRRHNSNALKAASSRCRSGDQSVLEMLAIWGFVVFSFAALVFACYVIWVKCASPSGF